jgi:hypothetical protein
MYKALREKSFAVLTSNDKEGCGYVVIIFTDSLGSDSFEESKSMLIVTIDMR